MLFLIWAMLVVAGATEIPVSVPSATSHEVVTIADEGGVIISSLQTDSGKVVVTCTWVDLNLSERGQRAQTSLALRGELVHAGPSTTGAHAIFLGDDGIAGISCPYPGKIDTWTEPDNHGFTALTGALQVPEGVWLSGNSLGKAQLAFRRAEGEWVDVLNEPKATLVQLRYERDSAQVTLLNRAGKTIEPVLLSLPVGLVGQRDTPKAAVPMLSAMRRSHAGADIVFGATGDAKTGTDGLYIARFLANKQAWLVSHDRKALARLPSPSPEYLEQRRAPRPRDPAREHDLAQHLQLVDIFDRGTDLLIVAEVQRPVYISRNRVRVVMRDGEEREEIIEERLFDHIEHEGVLLLSTDPNGGLRWHHYLPMRPHRSLDGTPKVRLGGSGQRVTIAYPDASGVRRVELRGDDLQGSSAEMTLSKPEGDAPDGQWWADRYFVSWTYDPGVDGLASTVKFVIERPGN